MGAGQQARQRILPLAEIFGGDGFHSWLDEIEEVRNEDSAVITRDESKSLRSAYEKYVEPIVTYEFPVVTLGSNTSLEAVCTIFETLNSTGVRLSVFDLLSARFYAKKENLRQLWEDAQTNSKHLKHFDIDPYYILQVICSKAKNSIKRSDVLALEAHEVVPIWEDAVWGMNEALGLLHDECGVLKPDLLSYNTILVPMAAIFMANRALKGPALGKLRNKVKRWYWCSVFGQTYESNPTSQTISDLGELYKWINDEQPPLSVRTFEFEQARLFTTTTKQRAVYRGVLCLILQHSPLDFHSTKKLTAGLIAENQVDDHHIFPKSYLDKLEFPAQEIDSILNRTLIDRTTNQIIGKNPPSKYLQEVEKQLGVRKLDEVLASHFLPTGHNSSLRRDAFEAFRQQRADTLYELIMRVTKGA